MKSRIRFSKENYPLVNTSRSKLRHNCANLFACPNRKKKLWLTGFPYYGKFLTGIQSKHNKDFILMYSACIQSFTKAFRRLDAGNPHLLGKDENDIFSVNSQVLIVQFTNESRVVAPLVCLLQGECSGKLSFPGCTVAKPGDTRTPVSITARCWLSL